MLSLIFILERVHSIKTRQPPCATFSGTYGHQTLSANTSSAQPAKGNGDAQHIFLCICIHVLIMTAVLPTVLCF